MKISVCIVTCNGEKFITRQIDSILSQTIVPDEIILIDDCSNDNTFIIARNMLGKTTIKSVILQNKTKLGINKSFEKCLSKASSDILVISDQDDFWFNHRLDNIKNIFLKKPKIELILVNAFIEISGVIKKETINDHYPYTNSFFYNFFKNRFTGCQIALKNSFIRETYPFPHDYICYYDHWISLFALLRKSTSYIDIVQGHYCRHSSNVTNFVSSRSFSKLIFVRAFLFVLIIKKLTVNIVYKLKGLNSDY